MDHRLCTGCSARSPRSPAGGSRWVPLALIAAALGVAFVASAFAPDSGEGALRRVPAGLQRAL